MNSEQPDKEKIYEILRRIDALPLLDDRTPDEIIGYDEQGFHNSGAALDHTQGLKAWEIVAHSAQV